MVELASELTNWIIVLKRSVKNLPKNNCKCPFNSFTVVINIEKLPHNALQSSMRVFKLQHLLAWNNIIYLAMEREKCAHMDTLWKKIYLHWFHIQCTHVAPFNYLIYIYFFLNIFFICKITIYTNLHTITLQEVWNC